MLRWVVLYLAVCCVVYAPPPRTGRVPNTAAAHEHEGQVVKGNRNALFHIQNGLRRSFPDFHTFVSNGFNISSIKKINDEVLNSLPLGDPYVMVAVYRPDDFMYHRVCDDADRMMQELGLVPNMGDMMRFVRVLQRVKSRGTIDILALGGSITAGGYFMQFVKLLREKHSLTVNVYNHGHGATELQYSIFCVDVDKYPNVDLVLVDFSVNDYGHPKLMDALLRKTLTLASQPVVAIVDLWVKPDCGSPRYLLHSYYYGIPLIDVCPAVVLCFGKDHLPQRIYSQYSLTDGVHPWGSRGVPFLGDLLFAWWNKLSNAVSFDVTMETDGSITRHAHSYDTLKPTTVQLPPPMYPTNPLGHCTRCDALSDDANGLLTPVRPPKGFRKVVRMKIGFGGFNAGSSTAGGDERTGLSSSGSSAAGQKIGVTKSFRRSWQAETPGSEISFKFYGSAVKIAIWQRRDGMGIVDAYVDGNRNKRARASGFFKGYSWAMEKNNTGRSEIMTLFEDLADTAHELTLVVSNEPANTWVVGHTVQLFALLSASNNRECKNMSFV
ncbi:hypothetical protein B484DRAFT_443404 [Ochromonadaceae sp. CCMP2298]|nr:hypothetical protein B484DRAFT_443404 [Ochromonadaceae sp. CCMP2298]|mmetsp:Transcript_10565/g.23462  ORF Transcript_10565/g.23462 Transcript_10565/m.23462 type:complete len:551 (-) Transcript_10565:43-1695(-)